MNIIYNENKNIIVKNEVTDLVLTSLDLFSFKFSDFTAGESTAALLLSDGFNEDVIVKFSESKDSDGNTFASIDELKSYLSGLCKKSPNLGTNIRLDNIELSNTGSHLKMVNLNTNEQSFMVQQRVDPVLGTTSVITQNTQQKYSTKTALTHIRA